MEFIRLFNRGKFFEAHEILESLWKETAGPERDFLKGLIQIAAAFVHIQKGTPRGARELFKTASSHFKKHPSPYKDVNTQKFLAEVERSLTAGGNFPRIKLEVK